MLTLDCKLPILFLGQPINGSPIPWEETQNLKTNFSFPKVKVEALLSNAYELRSKKKAFQSVMNGKTIKELFRFDGTVMMDSGGFQFQKRGIIDTDQREILEIQKYSKADIDVMLDYPLDMTKGIRVNQKRMKKSLTNLEIALKEAENPKKILPVVHGYSVESLRKYVEKMLVIYDKACSTTPTVVGIGSLVPLMKSYNKVKDSLFPKERQHTSGRKQIVDLLIELRSLLPESIIHAFGVGASVTSMYILFYLGIESVDSVAWRLQAAGGKIALPRIGTRKLKPTDKSWARVLTAEEWVKYGCSCPICQKVRFEELQNDWSLMALHNVWTYHDELFRTRKAISENEFAPLAESRLRVTNFYAMFRYAKEQIRLRKGLDWKNIQRS